VRYPLTVDLSRTESVYPRAVADVVATAQGRLHRDDQSRGRTGGPAGNARLTAWTGLVLLVLLAVEGFTLLSLGQLLGVHIFVGALLIPPVLLKTATTSWRILRYYTGDAGYVQAGPPPLVLRMLGPVVVATTLAVLGTGVLLITMGGDGLRASAILGLSMLTLHKASFILWFAAMTVHVVTRAVPALRIVAVRDKPRRIVLGETGRIVVLVLSLVIGLFVAAWVLDASSWWTTVWRN